MTSNLPTHDERTERKEFLRFLRETPADDLGRLGEAAAVEAFHRVAETVPFYARLLREVGVDPSAVTSISDFRAAVPLLDKRIFATQEIADLCVGGDLGDVRGILTSSGFGASGFSFGVSTAANLAEMPKWIDGGLEYLFEVDEKKTLLINCLSMGVRVTSKAVAVAETSAREDVVCAIVRKFAARFDQILILGDPSFVKKVIEDGTDLFGIDWTRLNLHLIIGGEPIAENYRSYMAGLLGIVDLEDPQCRLIASSMGVAELDLNIFHETRETIRIRRFAHRNAAFRKSLFGNIAFCPMLFVSYPLRCFVEDVPATGGRRELVVSMLSPDLKIPLLRYRTGDLGVAIPLVSMVEQCSAAGLSVRSDCNSHTPQSMAEVPD